MINPLRVFEELSYENNVAVVEVEISENPRWESSAASSTGADEVVRRAMWAADELNTRVQWALRHKNEDGATAAKALLNTWSRYLERRCGEESEPEVATFCLDRVEAVLAPVAAAIDAALEAL